MKYPIKTPIADAYRKWEKISSLKEKQQFCNKANALAKKLQSYTVKNDNI